jgi:hypothetical protein
MPVGQADAQNADGTPKGGAFVRLKEKLSVTIKGQSTKSPPTKLSPFSLAVNGYAAKYWVVTNLKISASNEGAVITTWNADLVEHVNTP